MTTTMSPPSVSRAGVPGAPALPQVNLLPPEIRSGRQLRHLKAWLAVALLVALLVAGLGFVWATFQLSSAEAELAETQDMNQDLVRQQAEFSEVTGVIRQIEEVTTARLTAMWTDIVWRDYLAAVAATAPTEVSFDSITVSAPTPFDASQTSENPLVGLDVGTITFTARSLTLPDTAAWMTNLETVRGFTHPWFDSATSTDEEGVTYFTVSGSVQLTAEAFSGRFVLEALEAADATSEGTTESEG